MTLRTFFGPQAQSCRLHVDLYVVTPPVYTFAHSPSVNPGRRRAPEKAKVILKDAQGSRIKVSDQRIISVEFEDVSGNKVKVEEVFLISSVVRPLLAVGKLLKQGWEFRNGATTGTFLVEGTTHIPVSYNNNNSLTAKAFVRAVNTQSSQKPIPLYLVQQPQRHCCMRTE